MINEKKNNTLATVVITLLVVAVIGLVAFIVYDKVIKKDAKDNNQGNSNNNNGEVTTKTVNVKIGDVVTIGTEKFYVISSDDTNVKMLAKYNLDVADANKVYKGTGLQDKNVLGTLRWSSIDDSYGTVVYDKATKYIKDYASELSKKYSVNITGELLTYEEAKSLKCEVGENNCINAPYWLYSSSFWINSENEELVNAIIHPGGKGGIGQTLAGKDDNENLGVRPVITISKKELSNFKIQNNDYEELEKKYSSLKYITDSKYIASVDGKNLQIIENDGVLVSQLATFENDGFKIYDASYKITGDRLCNVSKNGIYLFITNGLSGNDEKLYTIYYNPDTNEKSELISQDVNGNFGSLISCK